MYINFSNVRGYKKAHVIYKYFTPQALIFIATVNESYCVLILVNHKSFSHIMSEHGAKSFSHLSYITNGVQPVAFLFWCYSFCMCVAALNW